MSNTYNPNLKPGTHEVPCTVEAGVFDHLDKVNREFAASAVAEESARIQEAFDISHNRLEHGQDIAHGLDRKFVGADSDSLTPRVPRESGHTEYVPPSEDDLTPYAERSASEKEAEKGKTV